LTEEKFIRNPFSTEPGARLYKTGDLARYLPDGNIEYLGRLDHQVKLRGFRIELGEIEAVLRQHPLVADAVVAVREDIPGHKQLVGYVVPTIEDGSTGTSEPLSASHDELRRFLQERLPEYMIPAAFMAIQAVPLSLNGKADRRALPAPEISRPQLNATYTAPQTAIERMIASIWQDVLHIDTVGLHDNFFDLGGHSLLMARVHSKLREIGTSDISIVDLFQYPTVNTLARYLSRQPTALQNDGPDDRRKEGRSRLKQQLRHRQPG
jgi:hypothetical protein